MSRAPERLGGALGTSSRTINKAARVSGPGPLVRLSRGRIVAPRTIDARGNGHAYRLRWAQSPTPDDLASANCVV